MKETQRWHSQRLGTVVGVTRWGAIGQPVLVFPTAGGDAEEIEREGLVEACGGLLAQGRVKLYSCDSVAGRALITKEGPVEWRMGLLGRFHDFIRAEVIPAIHADSGGSALPVVAAGASIGAFNALAVLCRFPDAFSAAVCMSGTYELQPLYQGAFSDDLYFASPLHFLPGLEGPQLDLLRSRFVLLASGEGAWEDIGQSWRAAAVLSSRGIPNRVDPWGPEWPHEWPTWGRMLPQYLDELT